MLKNVRELRLPDPYFNGALGIVGSTIEELHRDVEAFSLAPTVPENIRRVHDAIRHTYIYSYFSYDLITVATAQIFPCLELALRERIGAQYAGRVDGKGKLRGPPMLDELLKDARAQGLISAEIGHLNKLRNMFAHGTDAILNPPLFLSSFEFVSDIIEKLFVPAAPKSQIPSPLRHP